jgi:hypothetical protein
VSSDPKTLIATVDGEPAGIGVNQIDHPVNLDQRP